MGVITWSRQSDETVGLCHCSKHLIAWTEAKEKSYWLARDSKGQGNKWFQGRGWGRRFTCADWHKSYYLSHTSFPQAPSPSHFQNARRDSPGSKRAQAWHRQNPWESQLQNPMKPWGPCHQLSAFLGSLEQLINSTSRAEGRVSSRPPSQICKFHNVVFHNSIIVVDAYRKPLTVT